MEAKIKKVFAILIVLALLAGGCAQSTESPSTPQVPPSAGTPTPSPQPLTPTPTPEPEPSLPRKIAFTSYRDGNQEIYVMDADGMNKLNLTNNPADDFQTSWSPDGSLILFCTDRDGNSEIYVMNSDGSNQRNLTNNSSNEYIPAWSPDGQLIACSSDRDGKMQIYTMNSDGSNQRNISNSNVDESQAAWSPDSKQIVFARLTSEDGYRWQLYIMNANGSAKHKLTDGPWDGWPAWSPDGKYIAFERATKFSQLLCINEDGSNQVQLTDASSEWNGMANWSPDGKYIAFSSDRDGNLEIYVMNRDDLKQTRLTDNPANDYCPRWSPQR